MALRVRVQETAGGWVASVAGDPSAGQGTGAGGDEALGVLVRGNPGRFGIDSLVLMAFKGRPAGTSCDREGDPDPDDTHTLGGLNRSFDPSGPE